MNKKVLTIVSLTVILVFIVIFFATRASVPKNDGMHEMALLDNSLAKYEELGIKKESTQIWEDGMRTDGQSGSYEWWYVDMELDGGITIVAIFFTKDRFDVDGPATPTADITITYPDGTKIKRTVSEPKGTVINSSKEKADVKIGDSYLRYVDGNYELYFNDGEIEYSAFMESDLPMWRPDTAHWYFGDEKKNFFAWFVAQPSSKITSTLTMDGVAKELNGTGYHDHNWGNVPMNEVINHWYWGRAKVGEYNVIAVDIISTQETGFTRLPVFMISKDGVILADDQRQTTVTRKDTIEHPVSGKFYDNHLTYVQKSNDETVYTVEMIRDHDIVSGNLLDLVSPFKKVVAKMIGMNPTYTRTLGEVILTIEKDGETQKFKQEGLWEQMFFGANKDAYIWN